MASHVASLLFTFYSLLFLVLCSEFEDISTYVVNCGTTDSRIIINDSSTESTIESISIPINEGNPCYLHISLSDTGNLAFEEGSECTITFKLQEWSMPPTSDPTLEPTFDPTSQPTTSIPTSSPSADTLYPTLIPSSSPLSVTPAPTLLPTSSPTSLTSSPTSYPTSSQPTTTPTSVTSDPTSAPTVSIQYDEYKLSHIFNINNQNIFWRNFLQNQSFHSFEFLPNCDTSKESIFAELDIASTNQTADDMWSLLQNDTNVYNWSATTLTNPSWNTALFPFQFSLYTDDITTTQLSVSLINETAPSITCYYGDVFDINASSAYSIDYYLFVSDVNAVSSVQNVTLDVIITTDCVSITTEAPDTTGVTIEYTNTTETFVNTTISLNSTIVVTDDGGFFDVDIELEFIIAISVVGFIILVVSIVAVIYLSRKKSVSMDDDEDTQSNDPNIMDPTNIANTNNPLTISEADHEEMLELARNNSLSTGLQE